MKLLILGLALLSFSLPAAARCVVEIINTQGESLAVHEANSCSPAMQRCQVQLARMNIRGAQCEITLDIPGHNITENQ
jgi:hypothetical protein